MPKVSKPQRRAFLLLCVVLSPPFLQRLWGQGLQLGSITGQVRVARESSPPEFVMVTLQARGITINAAYTDGQGTFGFHGLPGNLYHVTINDPKYRPVEYQVAFNPALSPTIMVQITLDPVDPPKPDGTAQPPASGGNPYLTHVADYAKLFPKKAVEQFERGLKAEQQGKTDEAVRDYRKALEIAPNFYPARNQLGVAFLDRRDFAAAEAQFEGVIKLEQTDAAAYFNLGNVFLLTNRYDDCLHMVEEGLRKQPNSGLGHFLLGSVYSRLGRLPEAERALRDAIQFDPSLSRPHLELVNLYLREKRAPDAISELKFFLKAFPADPLVPGAKQVLVRLESSLQQVSKSQ